MPVTGAAAVVPPRPAARQLDLLIGQPRAADALRHLLADLNAIAADLARSLHDGATAGRRPDA